MPRIALSKLVADTEFLDKSGITGIILFHEVSQKATAPVNQGDQTALCAEVLLVDLHVLSELKNPVCEYGDLDFAGTAVLLIQPVLFNQLGLGFFIHYRISLASGSSGRQDILRGIFRDKTVMPQVIRPDRRPCVKRLI